MITIRSSYIQLLTALIGYLHRDSNLVNPLIINKAKFYARTLFVAYWYVNKPGLTIREVGLKLKERFGASNLFEYFINNLPEDVLEIFDGIEKCSCSENLGTAYEQLLSIDTSGFEVKPGKEYRNKLGSYYTPKEYAEKITGLTLDEYLKLHPVSDLKIAKIVDFSCGCGAFLLAALSMIEKQGLRKAELTEVLRNIYACDVDPIALEITKISLLDFCDAPSLYDEVSDNFKHSNFLIHSNNEASSEERLSIAMCGFIYHEKLALGVDFLQQYDIILGNPPWEKIRFEEKKFFSQFIENISLINFKFNLDESIEKSMDNNHLMQEFTETYKFQLEIVKKNIKHDLFFKDSVNGELNTCSLFADSAYKLLANDGAAGLFVKSSLFTAKINKNLFSKLKGRTIAIYDFINKNKIFDIDSRERFGILLLGNNNSNTIRLGMNLLSLPDIQTKVDDVQLSVLDVLNPETKMIPNLKSGKDLLLLSNLYSTFEVFSTVFPDAKFGRLVHLTNHIRYIDKEPMNDNLPIIEGKFFSLFDNSYSGFNDVPIKERYKSKASSRKFSEEEKASGKRPLSRFFIKKDKWNELSKQYNSEYMLAWHSLTSATNLRSCVATLLPFCPGSQSVQFLTLPNNEDMIYLVGIFNSVIFDYIVKCKLNGIDLTQTIIAQLPIPSKERASNLFINIHGIKTSALYLIKQVIKEIYSNDSDLSLLFCTIGGHLFKRDSRKDLLRCLEVVVAKLYQLDRAQFEYILTFFNRFYSDDFIKSILESYDKIS